MLKNNLIIAFRNLLKHKTYSLINILGLAIGIACSILIFLWVRDELIYDKYHKNINQIYRVVNETNIAGQHTKTAITSAPMASALRNDFTEVENAIRFTPYL